MLGIPSMPILEGSTAVHEHGFFLRGKAKNGQLWQQSFAGVSFRISKYPDCFGQFLKGSIFSGHFKSEFGAGTMGGVTCTSAKIRPISLDAYRLFRCYSGKNRTVENLWQLPGKELGLFLVRLCYHLWRCGKNIGFNDHGSAEPEVRTAHGGKESSGAGLIQSWDNVIHPWAVLLWGKVGC